MLFYYLRRWQLKEEAKRAERVPTLDDEIKRSANLRHIKSMFEEVDIEEEEEEEEELDEWGRVKKKKKKPWWRRVKLDWSWEDVGAAVGNAYRAIKKFLFTATFGAPVSETSVSITEFIHIFQIDVRSEWAQRFIALLDADGNGTMELQEFVVGVGTLSVKDKNCGATDFGNFCFKLLDLDDKGALPREELLATVWRYVRYRECRANDKADEVKAKTDYKDRYMDVEVEAALNDHRRVVRDYRAKMYLGRTQNWDKLGRFNRSDGAEEVQQWAEDAAREAEVRDPRVLKESKETKERRRRMAAIRKKMRDAVASLRVETAADSIDDRSASTLTTRDGALRKDRGPPSLRVQGKAADLQRTAEMRVNALVDMPEHEAVGELTYLTLRARVLALNMVSLF